MFILAVDPSLHCSGWVLLDGEKPIAGGTILIPSKYRGDEALGILAHEVRGELAHKTRKEDIDILAYETQYPGRKAGGDAVALVGRAAGIWIGAVPAERVMGVAPMVWGKAFGLPKLRADRKKASISIARGICPSIAWEEDSADAFLIGLYAARTLQKKGL